MIFFYDNGSRGRAVLKDFIGDAELAALQSDGYNAYNYIDNLIAEQCIRPLTRERSNSIHFASHRGAEVSAIFHTVFSTCRMVGVSVLDYLKKFFETMLAGRTDYDNLLPSTIGLKIKLNLKF